MNYRHIVVNAPLLRIIGYLALKYIYKKEKNGFKRINLFQGKILFKV
jgi:hypothetical protein